MTGGEAFTIADLSILTLLGLTVGAFFCSFVVGLSAVGGGMLLATIIAPVLGVKAVLPVISIYSLFSNVARAYLYRESIAWRQVMPLMIPLIPATALGTIIYVDLDPYIIAAILGVVLIVSVPVRRMMHEKKLHVGNKGLFVVGGTFGVYSGMALGGGLILIPFLFGAGLFGHAIIATDAVVSIIINMTRAVMFGTLNILDLQLLIVGTLCGIVSFPGVMMARWVMDRTPIRVHTIAMEILLIAAGFYFLWKAYNG